MLDLNNVRIFIKIIEYGSFSKAAKSLGIPKSRVSRGLSALEKEAKSQLIYRTTRNFQLTTAGQKFYAECRPLLHNLETATDNLQSTNVDMVGKLRITAPLDMGVPLINPIIQEFRESHPRVTFELKYTDDIVDLIKEGFDVAIRATNKLNEDRLKARRVGYVHFVLVASPTFVHNMGKPQSPEELINYPLLSFSNAFSGPAFNTWVLESSKRRISVKIDPAISLNFIEGLRDLALKHNGITLLPNFHVEEHINSGQLIRILPEWESAQGTINIVSPNHKEVSPRMRAFLDFAYLALKKRLSGT